MRSAARDTDSFCSLCACPLEPRNHAVAVLTRGLCRAGDPARPLYGPSLAQRAVRRRAPAARGGTPCPLLGRNVWGTREEVQGSDAGRSTSASSATVGLG